MGELRKEQRPCLEAGKGWWACGQRGHEAGRVRPQATAHSCFLCGRCPGARPVSPRAEKCLPLIKCHEQMSRLAVTCRPGVPGSLWGDPREQ